MLSQIPIDLDKVSSKDIDNEILRIGILAEIDAINLYEQMAATATKEPVKKVMLDVAKEEKTHIGEFQALLLDYDKEQKEELVKGRQEVEEMMAAPVNRNNWLIIAGVFVLAFFVFSLRR